MQIDRDFPLDHLVACVQRLDKQCPPRSLVPMPGGASTRRFVRVHFESGGTAVAMYFPEATRSDEVNKPITSLGRWPFLQVHDLLTSCKVNVPEILAEDCEHGLLLVEDLGEDTLANFLVREPEARDGLYQMAVRDLSRAQSDVAEGDQGSIVQKRSFDFELLHWEVEHFREWALEALGVVLSPAESTVFERAAIHIAREAQSWPRVFVHRDYQSRNLMVKRGPDGAPQLIWIDFQDALMGPRVYDLVALLNDSYQAFSLDFIAKRLSDYLTYSGSPQSEMAQLRHEFDWMTVQRKLKDAGRFVYIDRVKGNSSFKRFVVPTVAKVRVAIDALKDDPIMAELAECLAGWYPQIQAAVGQTT